MAGERGLDLTALRTTVLPHEIDSYGRRGFPARSLLSAPAPILLKTKKYLGIYGRSFWSMHVVQAVESYSGERHHVILTATFFIKWLPRGKPMAAHPQQPSPHAPLSHPPRFSTMSSSKPPKDGRDGGLTALGLLIQTLNIAKDACGIPPAQVALGSASTLLTMIRVRLSLLREVKLLTHVV